MASRAPVRYTLAAVDDTASRGDGAGGGASAGPRVGWILVGATACFLAGLVLPILVVDKLAGEEESSILSGLVDLVEGDDYALAALIFAFSVVFPIVKLTVLTRIVRLGGDNERALERLALAGKWSMLDVCVVIVFASAIQLGLLAEARTGPGLVAFSAGVLGTMVVTAILLREARTDAGADPPRASGLERALAVLAFAALAVALTLPLMEVEKWAFWSNDASVASSLVRMIAEGEWIAAVLLAAFVVLLPVASTGLTVVARFRRSEPLRLRRWLGQLDEWALHDVYAFALVLFWFKARSSASIEPRWGYFAMLTAAVATLAGRQLAARRYSSKPTPNDVPGSSGG